MRKAVTLAACAAMIVTPVAAQTPVVVATPASSTSGVPEPIKPLVAQTAAQRGQQTVLPANTEILLSMNDDLTTKGGAVEEGTTFGLTVVHDVKLGDYIVIPKGSRGVGEVTWKTGKGAFGKSGKMDIALRYVEVNEQRVPVEGTYRQEGEGNTVATVAGVVAAGIFAAFITGKSAKIPRGRELVARTKEAIPVALPTAAVAPATIPAVAAN